jgi:hypothetical protein
MSRYPLCPKCGKAGRLVRILNWSRTPASDRSCEQQEDGEFCWCRECWIRWPSREELMEAPDASTLPDRVEPGSRSAQSYG